MRAGPVWRIQARAGTHPQRRVTAFLGDISVMKTKRPGRALFYVTIAVFLFGGILALAVGPVISYVESRTESHRTVDAQDSPSLEGSYLASRVADLLYDSGKSAEFFLRAANHEESGENVLVQAFGAQYCCGRVEDAERIARKLEAQGVQTPHLHEPRAAIAIRNGDWDEALGLADSIAEDGNSMVMAAIIRAWSLAATGKGDAALGAMDAAGGIAGLTGGDGKAAVPTHIKLQHVLLNEWLGRREMAEIFANALFHEVYDHHLVLDLAAFYARAGNWDKVHKLVEERLEGDFNIPVVKDFLKAAAPEPTMITSHLSAAIRSLALASKPGRFPQRTASRLRFSLHVDAGNDYARAELAKRLVAFEQYDEAFTHLGRLSNRDPLGQEARLVESYAYEKMEDFAAASERVKAAIRHNPRDPGLREFLGDVYRNGLYYKQSRQAYARALRLGRKGEAILRRLGIVHYGLGDHQKAETYFLSAIEVNPHDVNSLNFLGYWYATEKRNLDTAMVLIERAAEERPDSAYVIDTLGWVHYRLGDAPKAVGFLERATTLKPGDPEITGHLGDAYWAVGRHEEARFKWRLAKQLSTNDQHRQLFAKRLEVGLEASDLPGTE